ncbi:MAG: response regulator transcription factor [Oscillospiraceae bacterium]|nr:response regulator transcription factor [Oscillospiraceae bacterium]MCL2278189.1 response regulator transcription factor [Oscillospiraceae bacterium]
MYKIFVVEDDEDIREIVLYALNSAGFETYGYETGEEFLAALSEELPSLVILDIMLPKEDGLSILKNLRNTKKTKSLPVIMLTAKNSEFDKVKGLDMGADDYISKPFSVLELIARVKTVLRRGQTDEKKKSELELAGLRIDNARREVYTGGNPVKLTFKEYELLHCLMLNAGIVMSRDKLMETVWGYDFEGETRTVDMHVKTLRKKLGESGELITTVRNVGYKLATE